MQVFFASIVLMVWLYSPCMMCNFVSFCFTLPGLGGHDRRSPRKPLDKAYMQQCSNSLIFVFVPSGLFFVKAQLLCLKMQDGKRYGSNVTVNCSNSGERSIEMMDTF